MNWNSGMTKRNNRNGGSKENEKKNGYRSNA